MPLKNIHWQITKRKLLKGDIAIIGANYCYFLSQNGQLTAVYRDTILSKVARDKITNVQAILRQVKAEYMETQPIAINRKLFFLLMDGIIELA